MRSISIKLAFAAVLMFCAVASAMAQGTVKGIVVDADNGAPLLGTSVYIDGTTQGTVSGGNGEFTLKVRTAKARIVFSFVGYVEEFRDVEVGGGEIDLGTIALKPSTVGVDEVYVTASFVRDRTTPVAVSTIEPQIIVEKLGSQEFPEILKSTPSIYATKAGGGFGDSRVYVRGFDSDNVGVLINGIPVNGMENGKVYWSNWSGLSDVTENMQVQRGLGATRLALSTVGGTINIITKSTDAQQGGNVYLGIGNDGYQKQTFTVSTGLLDNGWAVTLSGGHTSGNGYVEATNFEGWTYFANISKRINDKHRLSFNVFGAPQWHNQRNNQHLIQDYRNHPNGIRWNSDYGYRDGKIYNTGYAYNYYHKPQLSLIHNWNISDKQSLSTQVYASMAYGGGRRVFGPNSNWLARAYPGGKPYEGVTKLTPEGYYDYDAVIAENAASATGSQCIIANAVNDHQWYGLLSTYIHQLGNLRITAGLDARYYSGVHTFEIDDLLGGAYFLDDNNKNRDPGTPLYKGDFVSYHNLGQVYWAGLFLQGEYVTDRYSAFLSASAASNNYQRVDYFNYTGADQKSKLVGTLPTTVKGGFSYNINENNFAFINGGFITKAPTFDNSFLNYTNAINEQARMEKIITAEVGYGFRSATFEAYANLFWTNWRDKALVRSMAGQTANIPGINALHRGVELEATYRPIKRLKTKLMVSAGDYIWQDDVNFTLYDDAQKPVGTYNAYIKGIHVGNSAQVTASLDVSYEVLPKLKIGADCNYYGKNFADFNPVNRTNANDRSDAWQIPDAVVFDLNANYQFKIGKMNATIYGNVHNLFNTEYIHDATDGSKHDMYTSVVYFAMGRTWSTGLRIRF